MLLLFQDAQKCNIVQSRRGAGQELQLHCESTVTETLRLVETVNKGNPLEASARFSSCKSQRNTILKVEEVARYVVG